MSGFIHNSARRFARALVFSPLGFPLRYVVAKLRDSWYRTAVIDRFRDKIAPLNIFVNPNAPRRINLLIPEISFSTFFGGYIAKFNLAKKLLERGHNVRVVIVDWCEKDPQKRRACISQYEGLSEIFDQLEIVDCHDRSVALETHPKDAVIATTWWTAHIAHHFVQKLECSRFIYLIQEYEPFTFAMGSYFAASHESYSFPHYALFSTELLQEFFVNNHYGVYAEKHGEQRSSAFQNAIVKFHEPAKKERMQSRSLLFYARPEAHASRNMFETAFIALSQAIEAGVFDQDDWQFHGIGTTHNDIYLPRGHVLKMLGKLGLSDYKQCLTQHDLGLSLMYTPHPSLLPLEMAAAGMLVVTNECMNKTAEKMQAISPAIIAAKPTIAGVASALADAVAGLGDTFEPAQVNWANDWDQAFSDQVMAKLESWVQS
jgi:hypothetical protein